MATQTQPLTLNLTRIVKAPAARVFKAWTDPKQMHNWFGCDQMASLEVKQDFRVGGDYRVDMHLHDGSINTVYGTFLEIVPDKKVAYTWSNESQQYPANDTLVTVEFVGQGDQTVINLTHARFEDQNSCDGHSHGWSFALDKFSSLFQ